MGEWLFWGAVLGGGAWLLSAAHRIGKREGSRKGYNVGRGRRRR